MDGGRQLTWRSAVVPVPAKGRVRLTPDGQTAPAEGEPEDARERAIEAMVSWCRDGVRPVWLVEGLAGAGKTGLASDVADRLSDSVACGWARPGLGAYAVTAAARNGRPALLLVDDAETRADVLELLGAVSERGQQTRIRVILTARDFGRWWTDLLARLSSRQRENLTSGRTVLTRAAATTAAPSPRAVALREVGLGEVGVGPADPRAGAATTLATADAGSAAVLLRQAAVVVALSTRVGQLGPAAVRSALRDLFEEEEGYWRRTSAEVTAPGQPQPALRSALTSAAVLGADGLAEAATVLRRVPALAVGAADRLARLAVWWHGRYARLGESSAAVARLPSWLADRMPDGTDSTGLSWTVAALDAERKATTTLHQMAIDAHRDVWPVAASRSADIATRQAATAHDSLRRAVAAVGPVDEALAWLTQELDLSDDDLDALCEAIGYPARSLSRTGIVLARRLLAMASDGLASHALDDPHGAERRAALTAGLGARYSEIGRWDEARKHTGQAVDVFGKLAEQDRRRFLPDLASAVSNLASCLAQLGEREEALRHSYDAVTLHRELVAADPGRHLPELARALTNLSACLYRSGRRTAALAAAGQAVALYRELVEVNPSAYAGELSAANHNWQVCRRVLGEPAPGRPPSQRSDPPVG